MPSRGGKMEDGLERPLLAIHTDAVFTSQCSNSLLLLVTARRHLEKESSITSRYHMVS